MTPVLYPGSVPDGRLDARYPDPALPGSRLRAMRAILTGEREPWWRRWLESVRRKEA